MPNSSATPAYDALCARSLKCYRLEHLEAMASADSASHMPPGGQAARAAALAELGQTLHALHTDPAQGALLAAAAQEPLDDTQQAELKELRRAWITHTALPARLVEATSLATSHCEHAWRAQRRANDWAGFLPNFSAVLRLKREAAQRLSEATGLAPYDALMDTFEPGVDSASVAREFAAMRQWLPDLIKRVRAMQAGEAVITPQGPFPIAAQRALCRELVASLGFDFEHGRLDESSHPFCGGVAEDVRMTTRYREDDFAQAVFGCIHETGHARYEQNLPAAWRGMKIGLARSMGVHESQSLSFEMQLARSPAFIAQLAPRLVQAFGAQPAFAADNLARWVTRVEPGKIRVDADELSYPCHIMLRFDLERALIGGELEAAELPSAWDEGMRSLLDIDTQGDYRDGCMQDIHWPSGAFGYFASYTLGAIYAAQCFAAMRRADAGFDAALAGGDFSPVFAWLHEHIWSQGARWSSAELLRRASGSALDAGCLRQHLEQRYLA